jgi:hypothetical protein
MEFDSGASSAGTDYGGFRVKLSDREKYYLRAAGIPPHLLNNNDRAAVIRALMMDNELIEDHRAGGFASFVFKMGGLRDMLEHTQAEIIEEDFSDLSGLDAEEQAMKSQGYTKDQILAFRRQKKEEEIEIANQRQRENNVKRANEEERLRREAQIFQEQGAASYAQMNPIPALIIAALVADQLGALNVQGKISEAIANPSVQTANLQNTVAVNSLAMNPRSITIEKPVMLQSLAVEGRSITVNQPVMSQSVLMAGKALLASSIVLPQLAFKIVAENVKDDDPTHLIAPMQERKVVHDTPAMGRSLPPLPHKGEK